MSNKRFIQPYIFILYSLRVNSLIPYLLSLSFTFTLISTKTKALALSYSMLIIPQIVNHISTIPVCRRHVEAHPTQLFYLMKRLYTTLHSITCMLICCLLEEFVKQKKILKHFLHF